MINNKEVIYTSAEASKKMGITRQALHYLVKQGIVKPVNYIIGKNKFYTEGEINKYLESKFKK